MERSTIDKGQDGILDKIEALLVEDNNGESVGFAIVTVTDKGDSDGSKLTTMSNMSASQLPRLMNTITQDLVVPALEGFEKTFDLVEQIEAKLGMEPENA